MLLSLSCSLANVIRTRGLRGPAIDAINTCGLHSTFSFLWSHIALDVAPPDRMLLPDASFLLHLPSLPIQSPFCPLSHATPTCGAGWPTAIHRRHDRRPMLTRPCPFPTGQPSRASTRCRSPTPRIARRRGRWSGRRVRLSARKCAFQACPTVVRHPIPIAVGYVAFPTRLVYSDKGLPRNRSYRQTAVEPRLRSCCASPVVGCPPTPGGRRGGLFLPRPPPPFAFSFFSRSRTGSCIGCFCA